MIKEVCLENNTFVESAIAKGADRIELCDNLAVGGTTVSYGVAKATLATANNIPVMAIIRPRAGDFVYNVIEKQMILDDFHLLSQLNPYGFVVGALTSDGKIDTEFMTLFRKQTEGFALTFHMAFDALAKEQQFEAIDWLAQNGFQRILTHGGPASEPIEAHLEHLKQLVDYAANRIIILPGGTVHDRNVDKITAFLQVNEAHGTQILGPL